MRRWPISFDTECACIGRRQTGWLQSGTMVRLQARNGGTDVADVPARMCRAGLSGRSGTDAGTDAADVPGLPGRPQCPLRSGGWGSWAGIIGRPQSRGSRAAGQGMRAQAIEQYWRLGALRRSRSGDFLSHSRSWQMSSRDETVRLGLARFLSGWRPCELNMEDSSRGVAIVPALDGWAVGHGSRKFVSACGLTTASRIRIPLAVCKS